MNEHQRLHIQQMMSVTPGAVDQTNLIRELKHSGLLRTEITTLQHLVQTWLPTDTEADKLTKAAEQCPFLYMYYTDLFNRIRKQDLDITLLHHFLDLLQQIEEGHMDQHDASFAVGTVLKKIYIDSALKRAAKQEEEEEDNDTKPLPLSISWKQYKQEM